MRRNLFDIFLGEAKEAPQGRACSGLQQHSVLSNFRYFPGQAIVRHGTAKIAGLVPGGFGF
jgi:hypothetical protein